MNDEILAIDPGREKTGIAILKNSDVLEHKIINSDELVQIIKSLLEKYIIKTIVMGNGTSSKKKYDLLKREFIDRDIVLINEYRTTDEARKLYFQENPPKGWKKLIPLGMQVPPVPVDDYAAIVIGRKYLKDNK
ncbi:MAG: pre-16S rRNA-processing nuclease YqgF [Megamonas funiformis]|jgi:RNase H-fold protein (predicted Holliday junction resolvase)|uniref:pre-16S rRNA-processing nuclease YqgF n=1 Tax=Megamonas TaxID=158846 RepID=UPI0022E56ACC|nr:MULTISPECIES: pre-16S rRNA-processing nuclease YqgF [Megamonas]MDY3875647.1 pre-16S rRNA-processing nuclease YqgF [Megamonas funiformis]